MTCPFSTGAGYSAPVSEACRGFYAHRFLAAEDLPILILIFLQTNARFFDLLRIAPPK